jgi:hypothetical protein
MTQEIKLMAIGAAMFKLWKNKPQSEMSQAFFKAIMTQNVELLKNIILKFDDQILKDLPAETQQMILSIHLSDLNK